MVEQEFQQRRAEASRQESNYSDEARDSLP